MECGPCRKGQGSAAALEQCGVGSAKECGEGQARRFVYGCTACKEQPAVDDAGGAVGGDGAAGKQQGVVAQCLIMSDDEPASGDLNDIQAGIGSQQAEGAESGLGEAALGDGGGDVEVDGGGALGDVEGDIGAGEGEGAGDGGAAG